MLVLPAPEGAVSIIIFPGCAMFIRNNKILAEVKVQALANYESVIKLMHHGYFIKISTFNFECAARRIF